MNRWNALPSTRYSYIAIMLWITMFRIRTVASGRVADPGEAVEWEEWEKSFSRRGKRGKKFLQTLEMPGRIPWWDPARCKRAKIRSTRSVVAMGVTRPATLPARRSRAKAGVAGAELSR